MSRIRADQLINRAASGAPSLTYGAEVPVGYGITGAGGINVSGIVTAGYFYGDGSNLTGAGSSVVDDTSTDDTFFPVLTQNTSGILSASQVSTTKLTFNPSSGILSATALHGDGSALTGIDATSLKDSGSTIRVQANTSGAVVTGVLTATSFEGDGSGLTGAGSTVFNDITTDATFFLTFVNTESGTITATGISSSKLTYNPSTGEATATNFNSTSDANLKTNVHTVENALDVVERLRGVSFDWKESGKSSYGVIAQELEEVLPELVNGTDPKSVNYNGIIGVLIEAIKELSSKVN